MEKIWYIHSEGKLTGPYSVSQLRCMPWLTPDTLVWKEGLAKPVPVRQVPELQELFEDAEPLQPESDEPSSPQTDLVKAPPSDELILDMGESPPPIFLWVLLAAAIIMLILLRFMNG